MKWKGKRSKRYLGYRFNRTYWAINFRMWWGEIWDNRKIFLGGTSYHLPSKGMQQKHIWREDMRLQHAKLEMPMDYLSSDVQKEEIYLILKFWRGVLAANRYLKVIIGNWSHEWDHQKECVGWGESQVKFPRNDNI